MNDEEREEFWKVLLGAKDKNDIERIQRKIIYPNVLYRYRSVNIRTLNALAENKLFFSTSNYYDDPFDTFIRIDLKKIEHIAQCFKTGKVPPILIPFLELIPKQNLSEENINIVMNKVIGFVKEVRNEIRKWSWSLCFTEKYSNETLWLKYADNHSGFVLEYDITNLNNAILHTEKSALCMTNNDVNFSLYPMYYSKDKNGYDSTDYAGFIAYCYLLEKMGDISTIQALVSQGNFMWAMERILLIKKWIHHYDEEWRMILNNNYRIDNIATPCVLCKPNKIILGLRMSDDDKKGVLMAIRIAGINSIEQMIINDNDEFVAKKITV